MSRLLFLLPVLFMACGTPPKAENAALRQAAVEPAAVTPAEELAVVEKQAEEETARAAVNTRNSGGLRQEAYDAILDDVKAFVETLNLIIKDRNYNKWRSVLSEEFFNEISSPRFLADASKWPSMMSRGIVLRTAYDYFNYVVVPSRANSRVDKIEIIDNNRVKAFYIDIRKDETVRLYELARMGDSWTIIR
jgi:hypothetical protein